MQARVTHGWRNLSLPKVKVMEGIFAVNKPPSVSSAGVLRSLQEVFNPSNAFAPWLRQEKARLEDDFSKQKGRLSGKQRRKLHNLQVKLGHGGTLDPLATGVLIVGLGSGTKTLSEFLGCTKTYETVVVFGAATDSYDAVGKLVACAPHAHVTRDKVVDALARFRGSIMQKPPVFSALKVNGKPLYEYARSGVEIPKEIAERPVDVAELELLEWMEPGTHDFQCPRDEADEDVVKAAKAILDVPAGQGLDAQSPDAGLKRKRDDDSPDDLVPAVSPAAKRQRDDDDEVPTMAGALPPQSADDGNAAPPAQSDIAQGKSPLPAARLRMTVSSGFYVRSLAHDLGRAAGSLAFMAALVRVRQADFTLGDNVLDMADFERPEAHWAPKLRDLLDRWRRGRESEHAGGGSE